MKIYNKTTGKMVDLTAIDRDTKLEWTGDLVGEDPNITYNDDNEYFEADQDTIDWWQERINELDTINDLMDQAEDILDYDQLDDLRKEIENDGCTDIDLHNLAVIRLLTRAIENAKES